MTNIPSMNAQHPALPGAPAKRAWKTPVLDILPLAEAQHGHSGHLDGPRPHFSHWSWLPGA